MVLAYLMREGHARTGALFAARLPPSVHAYAHHRGLCGGGIASTDGTQEERMVDALEATCSPGVLRRQRVRALLCADELDQVFSLLREQYAPVLENHLGVLAWLHTLKFVQLVAAASRQEHASSTLSGLAQAVEYGQKHMAPLQDLPQVGERVHADMRAAYSLLAYPDARQCPAARLLSAEYRRTVADRLNSAILGMVLCAHQYALCLSLLHTPSNYTPTHMCKKYSTHLLCSTDTFFFFFSALSVLACSLALCSLSTPTTGHIATEAQERGEEEQLAGGPCIERMMKHMGLVCDHLNRRQSPLVYFIGAECQEDGAKATPASQVEPT
jgi:CTLH/CRA C-terminal to LisH motif domain